MRATITLRMYVSIATLIFSDAVVMGNAHLSMYFSIDQDPKLLKQCASAYQQAVSSSDLTECCWFTIALGEGPSCSLLFRFSL